MSAFICLYEKKVYRRVVPSFEYYHIYALSHTHTVPSAVPPLPVPTPAVPDQPLTAVRATGGARHVLESGSTFTQH